MVLLLKKVEGMEVGVTLALNGQEGTLKLSVLECGCYVKDISIKLDGGASWLYQGYATLNQLCYEKDLCASLFLSKVVPYPLPCSQFL